MVYREVGGSLTWQGTVSGTDQTTVGLYEPTSAVRVFLENPGSPTIENNFTVFNDGAVINTTASGFITITGAGSVDVFTEGNTITVSGSGGAPSSNGIQILNQQFTNETFVDFTHNFNTISYLTTILDASGKVLGGETTQNVNSVQVEFNSPQSGTIIVISADVGFVQSQAFSA